jgi:regulator of replication initiation timing
LLTKQYGDKLLLEEKTEENGKLKIELNELRAKLDLANKKEY